MKRPLQGLFVVAFAMTAQTASAKPRVLASGAPACGNTMTKKKSPCQEAELEVIFARRELAAAIADTKATTPSHRQRIDRATARVAKADDEFRRKADNRAELALDATSENAP